MAVKEGAKESDSLTDKTGGDPPPEGKKEQKSTETLLAEYKAEAERKGKKISDLEESLEEKEVLEERLAELEEKSRLSPSEKREVTSIDKQIEDLEGRSDTQAFFEWSRRHTKKEIDAYGATSEANVASKIYSQLAEDWISDKAEELSKTEGYKGLTAKELRKLILPYAGAYQGDHQHIRAKKATKDWLRSENLKTKEQRLDERERKDKEFSEDGQKIPRESERKEDYNLEDDKDRREATKKLGL